MKQIISGICLIGLLALGIGLITDPEVEADDKPEVKSTNLLRTELELTEGVEVIVSAIEIPPETTLPTHYHPGEEFVYITEGSGIVWQKGKPDIVLKKGDVFKVPLKQVHTAKTGKEGFKALVFRVHKKGEPERILTD